MKPSFFTLSAVALLAIGVTSCKDDPEMVRKRDEQRAELTRLQGEIAVLDEKLKDVVPDRSKELATAKAQSETQATEIARVEKEIASLESRKSALEQEFSEYRKKYVLKNN